MINLVQTLECFVLTVELVEGIKRYSLLSALPKKVTSISVTWNYQFFFKYFLYWIFVLQKNHFQSRTS